MTVSGLAPVAIGTVLGSLVYVAVLGKLLWRHAIKRAPTAPVGLVVIATMIALIALQAYAALGFGMFFGGFVIVLGSILRLDDDKATLWQAVLAGQTFLAGLAAMLAGPVIWSMSG